MASAKKRHDNEVKMKVKQREQEGHRDQEDNISDVAKEDDMKSDSDMESRSVHSGVDNGDIEMTTSKIGDNMSPISANSNNNNNNSNVRIENPVSLKQDKPLSPCNYSNGEVQDERERQFKSLLYSKNNGGKIGSPDDAINFLKGGSFDRQNTIPSQVGVGQNTGLYPGQDFNYDNYAQRPTRCPGGPAALHFSGAIQGIGFADNFLPSSIRNGTDYYDFPTELDNHCTTNPSHKDVHNRFYAPLEADISECYRYAA